MFRLVPSSRCLPPALALAAALAWPVGASGTAPSRECDYCRMPLSNPAFGGEVRLRSGAVRRYDSIECMAAAVLTDSVPRATIRTITVSDHDAPHSQLPVGGAVLLHCPRIESPMEQSLLALRDRPRARAACPDSTGAVLDWVGVLAQVNRVWFQGKLSVERHAAAGVKAPPRR